MREESAEDVRGIDEDLGARVGLSRTTPDQQCAFTNAERYIVVRKANPERLTGGDRITVIFPYHSIRPEQTFSRSSKAEVNLVDVLALIRGSMNVTPGDCGSGAIGADTGNLAVLIETSGRGGSVTAGDATCSTDAASRSSTGAATCSDGATSAGAEVAGTGSAWVVGGHGGLRRGMPGRDGKIQGQRFGCIAFDQSRHHQEGRGNKARDCDKGGHVGTGQTNSGVHVLVLARQDRGEGLCGFWLAAARCPQCPLDCLIRHSLAGRPTPQRTPGIGLIEIRDVLHVRFKTPRGKFGTAKEHQPGA